MKKLNSIFYNSSLLNTGLKDTFFYFVSQVGTKLVAILAIPFITRIVSPSDFANYDIFLLSNAFLSMLVSLGTDSGVAIFLIEDKENENKTAAIVSFCLSISISLIGLLWLIAILANSNGSITKFTGIPINLFFLNLGATYIINFSSSFFRWKGKAKTASIIAFLGSALGVILGFILINKYGDINSFIYGILIGNIFALIFCIYLMKNYFVNIKIAENKNIYLELLKVSLPFIPSYLSFYLALYLDRFLVIQLLGTSALGLYALASRVAQIPNFGLSILTKGFQPVMLNNYQTEEGIQFNKKIYHYFLMSLLPLSLLMTVSSKLLIQIFGGNEFSSAYTLLPMISISSLILGGMSINGFGYTIKKKSAWIFYTSILIISSNAILAFPLSNLFGVDGIALATLIATCVGCIFYTYYSERLYSFNLSMKLTIVIYAVLISGCTLLLTQKF